MALEPHVRDETSKAYAGLQRCKYLAKAIKSQRAPIWLSPLTADLPPKPLADDLVDCYLRTSETLYRVLHIPTFKRDYEALWSSNTEPGTPFLIQLKLVLAIGATTYDENFSLRDKAVKWVYEAQSYFSAPDFKARLNIQSLQSTILLLLARESTAVGPTLIWNSAGELCRTGVILGLHRDPSRLPCRTTYAAEMRRRIWNTILEINLQSSLTAGGPPLLSLEDFDTEPPGNFDDDQLTTEGPAQKPELEFTQVSIAIALRKTFPIRLAIVKLLNNLSFQSTRTYEETLHLDAELKAAYKVLRQTLQGFQPSASRKPSQFELRVVDLLMHRYHSALHIPCLGLALHDTAHAFSRKVVVETSLKIWSAASPSPSLGVVPSSGNMDPSDRDDLARLMRCGSGFFRTVAFQASLLIAMELVSQLQEEDSLGPAPLRPDLLSVLENAKSWCLQCIKAGETNIKGYLLVSLVAARILGLIQGLGTDQLSAALVKAAEDVQAACLPILEEMAGQGQSEGARAGPDQISLHMQSEAAEDWDFMVSSKLPPTLYIMLTGDDRRQTLCSNLGTWTQWAGQSMTK